MKSSDYYLYIVPQTGSVFRCKDFNRDVERLLCEKYGRIWAISGYSNTVKIVTLVYSPEIQEHTRMPKEMALDCDLGLASYEEEIFPVPEEELTEEDIEEGIRCSLL